MCLFVFMLLRAPMGQHGSPRLPSSLPTTSSPQITIPSPEERRNDESVQIPSATQEQAEFQVEEKPPVPIEAPDETDAEIHQKMAAGLKEELQRQTRKLYGVVFQQMGLSTDIQDKVIDILTQQPQQLEQQAFDAAQSGGFPEPPSIEKIRAQEVQQEQQLRSLLGNDGYAQLTQYQATIPDRIIVDEMNQQGGNLNETQSSEFLKVLTETRQQIMVQSGTAQNLASMSPNQAIAVIQQQQSLLQQTVNNRVQNILTPNQQTTLQGVLSGLNSGPLPR